MASQAEDDLQASKTEGFKVGEKKTLDEYAKLGTIESLLLPCDMPDAIGSKHSLYILRTLQPMGLATILMSLEFVLAFTSSDLKRLNLRLSYIFIYRSRR